MEREGPPALLPMPHPQEAMCGHGLPIAFCGYERCVARLLYEALAGIQWGHSEVDYSETPGGTAYYLCPECDHSDVRGHQSDCTVGAALAKAKGEDDE